MLVGKHCGSSIYRFMEYCQTDDSHDESSREARALLYRTLLILTFGSDELRVQLTTGHVPEIVGRDLQKLTIYIVGHCLYLI